MDPIEELARREANKEKAQPYIERRLALGLSRAELAQKQGWTNPLFEAWKTEEAGLAGIPGKS